MKNLIELLQKPETSIALVGASENPRKFGNVIFRDLVRKNFTVYPVNPYRKTLAGARVYARLVDVPQAPDLVNFVVPPEVTLEVLPECLELDYMNVWLQPGAESPAVMAFLQENDFNYLADSCIMVESRFRSYERTRK